MDSGSKDTRKRSSSEFAFNTDDVPCFPFNDHAYPLQVPVHPGSIGVFEKVPFSREEMFAHFRGMVEKGIRDCGCAILCDHPLGRVEKYEKDFLELLEGLVRSGYRCVPVSEYAEQARSFLVEEFQPIVAGPTIRIEGPCSTACRFEVVLPREGVFEVGDQRDVLFREGLEQVEDLFECPPRPEFDRFLSKHGKDERLTSLTLMQWYRGLTRHNLGLLRRKIKGLFRGGKRP